MKLELTAAAVSDLQSIRSYTLRQWGAAQEQLHLDGLWEKFQEILVHPEGYRRREDLFPGCRLAAQGKHVVLFRTQGELLQIVRILHSAMDYPKQLDQYREPPEL